MEKRIANLLWERFGLDEVKRVESAVIHEWDFKEVLDDFFDSFLKDYKDKVYQELVDLIKRKTMDYSKFFELLDKFARRVGEYVFLRLLSDDLINLVLEVGQTKIALEFLPFANVNYEKDEENNIQFPEEFCKITKSYVISLADKIWDECFSDSTDDEFACVCERFISEYLWEEVLKEVYRQIEPFLKANILERLVILKRLAV